MTENNTTVEAEGAAVAEEENVAAEAETPKGAVTRDEAIRAADARAASDLRATYRDEFNAAKKQYAAEAGFDWSPKKTQEEKDREAFEELLAKNPGFRSIV